MEGFILKISINVKPTEGIKVAGGNEEDLSSEKAERGFSGKERRRDVTKLEVKEKKNLGNVES